MRFSVVLTTILVICGCKSKGPLTPQIACDVERYQPLAVGKYWVYERVDSATMKIELDSIVVASSTVVAGQPVYTIRSFTSDSLQSVIEAKFVSEQLLETLACSYNDLLTKSECNCPQARGVVLLCGIDLPGVRGSAPGDSLPALGSGGEVIHTTTQYLWATSGAHTTGTFKDLGSVLFGPAPIHYTPMRTLSMVVNDSLVFITPEDFHFPNGKRHNLLSHPDVNYVRRLVRYGTT